MALYAGGDDGVSYLTVYLIERTLSLDNLVVFLLIFASFAVPPAQRGKLLFWGIVLALVMRGVAIVVGVELIERFHIVIYLLGVGLLILAWKMWQGSAEHTDPHNNPFVQARLADVPGERLRRDEVHPSRATGSASSRRWRSRSSPIVAADIAFAIDSIPAAFAITDNPLVIWTANGFALLGLRALFALVEELVKRFRYLNQTVAIVLGVVAVKLLIQDLWKMPALDQPVDRGRALRARDLAVDPRGEARGDGGDGGAADASAQLGELTRDLGLDVERRLPGPCAARVARDHEVADLGLQRRVGAGHDGSEQRGELGLDVQQRASRALAHGVAGPEQLAQLGLLLGPAAGAAQRAGSRGGRSRAVAQREQALADLVVGAPGARERHHGDERRDADDGEEDGSEGGLHRVREAWHIGRVCFPGCFGVLLTDESIYGARALGPSPPAPISSAESRSYSLWSTSR